MSLAENIVKQFDGTAATGAHRHEALEAFRQLGIPTSRHEEWKYTNIKTKLSESLSLGEVSSEVNAAVKNYIASLPPYAFRIIFLNGVFHPELSIVPDMKGFSFYNLHDLFSAPSILLDKYYGRLMNYRQEHFAALNTAFVRDGACIHVAKNTIVNDPIYIQYFFTASEAQAFTQTRNLIVVEEGAHCNWPKILETPAIFRCSTITCPKCLWAPMPTWMWSSCNWK